mmetsp:Transcript_3269/g.4610  ORF Transcript_3269/g.4610 Transcript_3269/m.4610 type:complete len:592 (+) Transcript_3269:72-1847(+)
MGCGALSKEQDFSAAGNAPDANQAYKNQQANEAAGAIGMSQGLSSKIQFSIRLNDLTKMDLMSKSDPFCVVKTKVGKQTNWIEIGRTEIIANTQNPEFVTLMQMHYHFEEMQYVRFECYDADSQFLSSDSKTLDLAKQDFQGASEVILSQMMGVQCRGNWSAPLEGCKKQSKNKPTITVCAEEIANVNALVSMELRAEGVVGKDLLSKADPFIRISSLSEKNSWIPCFKTEVKRNTSRPTWNMISSTVQILANGDVYRPLQFECFDHNSNGSHALIGSCQVSLNDLEVKKTQASEEAISLPLVEHAKKGNSGYMDSGKLFFEKFNMERRPSFLDYIKGGSEISFIVAIDYTASNGDPVRPDSLHYVDPTGARLNQYANAILGIGNVIEFYDSDKKFPVFGFGGKQGGTETVSHCFAANGNPSEPDAHPQPGVAGILQTYYNSMKQIRLSGPTLFAPLLAEAAALAQSAHGTGQYYILLILTDGVIHDMPATVETIVGSAHLPLSILIVGVGDADFSAMEELDGDQKRLKSMSGKEAPRDIVQFVELSKYQSQNGSCNQHELAKELLAEVPFQFLSYMSAAGISPGSAVQNL